MLGANLSLGRSHCVSLRRRNRKAVCVRTVSHAPVEHGDLGGHADGHQCCGKSLIGSALVGFGVRQHARENCVLLQPLGHLSVFRINNLRAAGIRLSHTSALRPSADAITFGFSELKRTDDGFRRKLCKTS